MLPWRRFAQTVLSLSLLAATGCGHGGRVEAVWCQTGIAPGEVVYPRGIAYLASDDSIFVIDRMARIQHLDHDGNFISAWRTPQWDNGRPVGLAVAPDGKVWVPDTHYSRILVYTSDGKLLHILGSGGTGPGQFVMPTDIKFDARGQIYISETGDNDRIQVFDPDFHYLRQFGSYGSGPGQFIRPQSMVIDGDTLYVTDACNHRICVFTLEGKFLRSFGKVGSDLGEFRFPYGLDQDQNGHLVVAEFGNNRIQLVDKATGKGLAIWGAAGREVGELSSPWGVVVDRHGRIIAVDAGNNRLQVFEF